MKFHVMLAALALALPVRAQTPPQTPDIPPKFELPTAGFDYTSRAVMIPMRDGVKLYTVIVTPKGARNAPILLTRTPYNAARRATRDLSPHVAATIAQMDEPRFGWKRKRAMRVAGKGQLLQVVDLVDERRTLRP